LIADSQGRLVEDFQPMTVLYVTCLAEQGGRREQNGGRLRAALRSRRAKGDATVEGGGDVVGVPLELGRAGEDRGAVVGELEHVVGGEQAGDDRRRARAKATGERNLAADAEADAVGRMKALERTNDQVGAIGRRLEALGDDLEHAGLDRLDLELEGERGGEDVVARAEVGR